MRCTIHWYWELDNEKLVKSVIDRVAPTPLGAANGREKAYMERLQCVGEIRGAGNEQMLNGMDV